MKELLRSLDNYFKICCSQWIVMVVFLLPLLNFGQSVQNYLEKAYVDIDKNFYVAGEVIWFKAYLVDARTNKTALSKVLYIDLIDPDSNIIETKTLKIGGEDNGAGEFQLSSKLTSGEYIIRAYSNYMRNFNNAYFFRRKVYIDNVEKSKENKEGKELLDSNEVNSDVEISVNDSMERPDLQFMPEGGTLVNGISNRIAFKIIDKHGKSISINGTIIDDEGNEVTKISTSKYGMGVFMIKPKKGKKYKASLNFQGKSYDYDFPTGVDKGVSMIVRNNEKFVQIILRSTLSNGINGLSVIGEQYGEIICNLKLKEHSKELVVKVKKDDLRDGVVQFTILDDAQRPLSERLVFVENESQATELSINSLRSNYENRELVEFDVALQNRVEKSTSTNMSISVSEVIDTVSYNQLDIKSQLLLNSELKGNIEQPSYYFKTKDPNRKRYLDLLMMTQGWRKYVWNEKEVDNIEDYSFNIESGFNFKGNVSSFYNHDKKKMSNVEISFMSDTNFSNFDGKTTDKGDFYFGDFDITDTTLVIITAKDLKKKKNGKSNNSYFISLDSVKSPEVDNQFKNHAYNSYYLTEEQRLTAERIERIKMYQSFDSKFNLDDVVQLDDIELKTIKLSEIEKIKEEKRRIYSSPSSTLSMDEVPFVPTGIDQFFSILQGRIPGIMVDGNCVTIRGITSLNGSNCALIVHDGFPIDASAVNTINPSDIDFIDILKGAEAVIYGSRGANGVVAIYSKDGRSEMLKQDAEDRKNYARKGIINIEHPGYSKAKEFYAPKYIITNSESDKPDYRSTLYWNPSVELSEEGKTRISFYSSDVKSKFRIEIEGITSDGVPIVEETIIEVQ